MRKTNTTNQRLRELISDLEKKSEESGLFGRIAEDISKPARVRREVNLSRINRYTQEGEVIVVPGKVLGGGEMDHKITISAFRFSAGALSKLEKSGSKIVPMKDITKESITGRRVKIIG